MVCLSPENGVWSKIDGSGYWVCWPGRARTGAGMPMIDDNSYMVLLKKNGRGNGYCWESIPYVSALT